MQDLMAQQGQHIAAFFLSLLDEIKTFIHSRGEAITLLQDTDLRLDFLTDITGKLNNLNCELQGKAKTVSEMISSVNTFRGKMSIFSVHLQEIPMLFLPEISAKGPLKNRGA